MDVELACVALGVVEEEAEVVVGGVACYLAFGVGLGVAGGFGGGVDEVAHAT